MPIPSAAVPVILREEVKLGSCLPLAGRSAEAVKEIKALISGSVERVEQGTVLVDHAGGTMAELVTSIRRATDLIGELVEEMAAAGRLRNQTQELVETVAVFKMIAGLDRL